MYIKICLKIIWNFFNRVVESDQIGAAKSKVALTTPIDARYEKRLKTGAVFIYLYTLMGL